LALKILVIFIPFNCELFSVAHVVFLGDTFLEYENGVGTDYFCVNNKNINSPAFFKDPVPATSCVYLFIKSIGEATTLANYVANDLTCSNNPVNNYATAIVCDSFP